MSGANDSRTLKGVHHGAFRCRDAEQTRWFYQDVLGLETEGAVIIEEKNPAGVNERYMHIFFRMGNGEYIAFFDAPGSADPGWFEKKGGFDMHWAFEVDSEADMLAMQKRIQGLGVTALGPVDHGFVRSVYMYDPNGIQVEITVRTPTHDQTFKDERAHLRGSLAEWTASSRAEKVAKFGAAALDRRGKPAR